MITDRGFCVRLLLFFGLCHVMFCGIGQVNTRAYDDGERFLYNRDFENAAAAYNHAKNHPAYEYKKTLCALMMGSKTASVQDYLAFEGQLSGSPTYFYWLGMIYIKNQMPFEAATALNKFLSSAKNENPSAIKESKVLINYLSSVDGSIRVEELPTPINSFYMESNACFTGDTKKLVFISERVDENQFTVYSSVLGGYGWNKPVELTTIYADSPKEISLVPLGNDRFSLKESSSTPVTTLFFEGDKLVKGESMSSAKLDQAKHFYITENKRKIIFSAETPGAGLDLFECIYLSTSDRWTNPAPVLGEVNTGYDEDYPFITPDRSKIYFSSNRPGGIGKRDIYFVEIDPDSNHTVKTTNLGFPINSIDDDIDFKIYDGQKGSFCSDRYGKSGNLNVFIFYGEDLLSQGK